MEIWGRGGRMPAARVEQKNGMTKEDKNGVTPPWTKKAPYKPDAGDLHVRFGASRGCGRSRAPASIALSRRRHRTRSPVALVRSAHARTRNWQSISAST